MPSRRQAHLRSSRARRWRLALAAAFVVAAAAAPTGAGAQTGQQIVTSEVTRLPAGGTQPDQESAVPLTVTWEMPTHDGFMRVTVRNDSEWTMTAFALGARVKRPDGSTVMRGFYKMDGYGAFVSSKLHPGWPAPPGGSGLLAPGAEFTHMARAQGLGEYADLTVIATAAVLESGHVLGNRTDVAMLLTQRENDAHTAGRWLDEFQAARQTRDRNAAATGLQQAVDDASLAARVGVTFRGFAERAIRQQSDARAFEQALAEGERFAQVYLVEGQRHLTPGR